MVTILMVFESAMHVRNCIRNELLRALGKKNVEPTRDN